MARWTRLLAGVALALWAEQVARGQQAPLHDAVLLYAAAAALFLAGVRPPERWPALSPRPRWRREALILVGAGLALGGLAIAGFWARQDDYTGLPLGLWLASTALLLVGGWLDGKDRPPENPRPRRPRWGMRAGLDPRGEFALLAVLVLVALFLRTWQLSHVPNGCQSDECNNALDALRWLQGEPYRPFVGTNEGQPTLFTYWIAALFALFGPSLVALRLAPALAGTLTVLAFYALARWRFDSLRLAGLLALLLAASRWHLTFSRIVYELILVPLVLSLLLWSLLRALRHGRRLDWMAVGFFLALGLNTYTAFRVVPLWIGLFAVYWLVGDVLHRERRPQLTRDLEGWALAVATFAVAVAPLGVFALRHWDAFTARMRHISVWHDVAAAGSYEPIRQNLIKALQMFSVRGDPAALNNLPSAPLLDAVTAALFVLGVAYALRYANRPLPFLYLTGLAAQLSLVVLTAAHEAPSARRPIAAVVLVYLLVGEALAQIWDAFDRAWREVGQRAWQGVLVAVTLLVAGYNGYLYFGVQARHPAVQLAFSPHEFAVGQYLRGLPSTTEVYVTRAYAHHSAVRFLGGRQVTVLDLARHVPVRHDPTGDAVYILDPPLAEVAAFLLRLYPEAEVQRHYGPAQELLFISVRVPAAAVARARGVRVAFFRGLEPSGTPVKQQRATALVLTFRPPPVPPPFTVVAEAAVFVPAAGPYTFSVDAVGEAVLYLDGRQVVTVRDAAAQADYPAAAGLLPLRLVYRGSGPGQVRVLWAPRGQPLRPLAAPDVYAAALPPNGLVGYYYPNPTWAGSPAAVRRDFFVAPNNLLREPFSIRWRGKIVVPQTGTYGFATRSDDGSYVFVDGRLVVDNGGVHGARWAEGALFLERGVHDLEVRYFQQEGAREIGFYWRPPGKGWEVVPLEALYPYEGAVPPEALRPYSVGGPAAPPGEPGPPERPIRPPRMLWRVGACGAGEGMFNGPRGLAVGSDGRIYVADAGNRRVVVLSPRGRVVDTWTVSDPEGGAMEAPFDVAVGPDGTVWVLDARRQLVWRFTAAGRLVDALVPASPWYRPRGLDVAPDGTLVVADTGGARVVFVGEDGRLLDQVGGLEQPIGPGQPTDVGLAAAGTLYIVEAEAGALWHVARDGRVLQRWPLPRSNTVDSPHLAVDPAGRVWVTGPASQALYLYTATQGEVARWGGEGLFVIPVGVALGPDGTVYVTDAGSCEVIALAR